MPLKSKHKSHKTTFILAGPSGVGKTRIGQELSQRGSIITYDVDEIFINRNGPISDIGPNQGWTAFFWSHSQLFREIVDECLQKGEISVIVTGAGTLFHPDFLEISAENLNYVKGRCPIICILPSLNSKGGANIAIDRQRSSRSYPISTLKKRHQYEAQFEYLRHVSDYLVLNVELDQAVYDVLKIINKEYTGKGHG
jgi:shikimate kinase